MNSPIPSHSLEPAQLRQFAYVLAVGGTVPKNTVLDGIRARLFLTFCPGFLVVYQSIYAAWAVCLCGFIVTLLLVRNHRWMISERQKEGLALYKFAEVSVTSDEMSMYIPLLKSRTTVPLNSLTYTTIDETLLVLRSKDFESSSRYFVAANEKFTLKEAIPFLKEHGCLPEEQQHPLLVEAPTPQNLMDKYRKYTRWLVILLIGWTLIGLTEIKLGDTTYSLGTVFPVEPMNPINFSSSSSAKLDIETSGNKITISTGNTGDH